MMRCLIVIVFSLCCTPLFSQTSSEIALKALTEQGNPFYVGNQATLLPSARVKYEDMFAAISNARKYVHVEYFIFRQDSIGIELINLLSKKCEEGVEVRVLIDAYGNYKSPIPLKKDDLDSIRKRSVKIELYDPLRFPWIPNMLHRDHRKIVVVDGLCAYTGGMNVADYYIHGTKRTGPWRDMQVKLTGPVVAEFQQIFAKIWEKQTGEHLDSLRYCAEKIDCHDKDIVVVNREPHRLSKRMRKAFVTAIDAASDEIRIVNPYPTNVRSVSRAMRRALKRGVKIQLMVSSSMDNRITPEVVGIQMKKMMKRGVEVYYYDGGFHHTKVMMIDRDFCSIGTANLDGRSMLYDYEVGVFVFSPSLTSELNIIFDKDLQQSQLLTPEVFKNLFPFRRRVLGRLFQPVKSFL